ncbi:MAG: competence protein ComK [Anaerobacillus sp.]|uniref:competence protein ComK n=1 Tax=Anaerobacillus sp. TaxID=1872506 RepID=UPI00391C75A3
MQNLTLYAFPTHSSKNYECSWIFPNHVKEIAEKKHEGESNILFSNLKEVKLDICYFMLERQIQRAAFCMMEL